MTPCHEILGLRPGAGAGEARGAWRRLARTTHPDRGGDPERFRQVTEAYRTVLRGASGLAGPATVVRHQGPVALAGRWLRRRRDHVRHPRVV